MIDLKQLHLNAIYDNIKISDYGYSIGGKHNTASKSAEITEQIAIEFAEWILDYDPTMLYQKTKKEIFQEYLKTKQ